MGEPQKDSTSCCDTVGPNMDLHYTLRKSGQGRLEHSAVAALRVFQEGQGEAGAELLLNPFDPSFLACKNPSKGKHEIGVNGWRQYLYNTNGALNCNGPQGDGSFRQTFVQNHEGCKQQSFLMNKYGRPSSVPLDTEGNPQRHTQNSGTVNRAMIWTLLRQSSDILGNHRPSIENEGLTERANVTSCPWVDLNGKSLCTDFPLQQHATFPTNYVRQKFPLNFHLQVDRNPAWKQMCVDERGYFGWPGEIGELLGRAFLECNVERNLDNVKGRIKDRSEPATRSDESPMPSCFVAGVISKEGSQKEFAQIAVAHSTMPVGKCSRQEVKQNLVHKRHICKKETVKPKRALTAYNFFFKDERKRLLEETRQGCKQVNRNQTTRVGFAKMAQIISSRWKALDPESVSKYKVMADQDTKRYKGEMEKFKAWQREKLYKLQVSLLATVDEQTKKKYFDSAHADGSP